MESGSLIRSDPLGTGDAIVMTGSANCTPLVLSTRTTFALTIRFRYVAEITRFSSSTKLMIEIMPTRVRLELYEINYNLYFKIIQLFYPARADLRSPVNAFSAALPISNA